MKNFKITFVDLAIVIGIIIALAVGFCTAKHYRQTADKQIETTAPVTFQVCIRGAAVTKDKFPICVGDKTFITIRNVPYTELNVINVFSQPRKTLANYSNGKTYAASDPAQEHIYDAIITISDIAKITKDGAVVGGNKIKIGLPVVLEGQIYKLSGVISDVQLVNDSEK